MHNATCRRYFLSARVPSRARVAMPSTACNCVNPIPDHGGTFLSEKLNPSGIWKGALMRFTVLARGSHGRPRPRAQLLVVPVVLAIMDRVGDKKLYRREVQVTSWLRDAGWGKT
jgi:hypothetical protein